MLHGKTIRQFVNKKGIIIESGESVKIQFDIPIIKDNPSAGFRCNKFSVTTSDGRRMHFRNLSSVGIQYPSVEELGEFVTDSCESVAGANVEPDGWDEDGYPSWLLYLGWI